MEPETFDKFYERKNKIKENLPTILAKVPQSLELIPHHPLYHTMILTAIKKLNEEHGSTEEAILKFIRDNFPNLSIAHARHVSHHLKKLEERKGIVRASNNRYMLPAEKEKVYVSEVARIFAKNRRQRSRRSVANTANRKAKDQEHHSGRKPIVRRMQKHKNEGCDFPVIKSYKETYPPEGDPKAAEAVEKMEFWAAELKNKQRAANPDVPEDELPQMEWSSNMEVLEYGVGTRHGKEIRGLGKGPVRELPTRGTSRTNVRAIEERLHSAEERAVKAEAISEGLQQKMELQGEELTAVKEKLKEMDAMQDKLKEMDELKQAIARMMQAQGSTQQQSDDVNLDGGR